MRRRGSGLRRRDFCTADSCDEAGDVCLHNPVPLNGTSCDDGLYCTVTDACSGGSCAGTARLCDDGIFCTSDSCDETGDACLYDAVPKNGTTCDDGNLCTSPDVCTGGLCGGAAIPNCCMADAQCNDGLTCTTDYCPAATNTGALNFDGTDDFVTMGAAAGVNQLGASAFTLEAWIRRDGATWGNANASTGTGGLGTAVALITKGRSEGDNSNVDCNYFFGLASDGRLVADFEQYTAAGGGRPARTTRCAAPPRSALRTRPGTTWR